MCTRTDALVVSNLYVVYSSSILRILPLSISTLFPYTTLFRSIDALLVAPFALLVPAWAGRRAAWFFLGAAEEPGRSEEHTLNSSHTVISYAVFCLKKERRMSAHKCG